MALPLTQANRFALLRITPQTILNAPASLFLTNSPAPLDVGGQIYEPEPTMVFDIPEYSGAVEDDEVATIRLADTRQIFRDAVSGRATATLSFELSEIAFDPQALVPTPTSQIFLWLGTADTIEINPEGEEGIVEITVARCGGRMDREVGPEVSNFCWKRYGDPKTCKATVDEIPVSIVGNPGNQTRVDLAADPLITGKSAYYWQNGSLTAGDIRITIRSWESGLSFILSEYPPQEWVGAYPVAATLRSGCRKTLADCRKYNNEQNYGGLGIRIPARNVLFELPQGS